MWVEPEAAAAELVPFFDATLEAAWSPRNLTERGLEGREEPDGSVSHQVVRAPLAILEAEGATIEGGTGRARLPHLAGSSPFSAGVTERSATATFTVRRDRPDATVRVTVRADKGGTARTEPVRLDATATE